MAIASKHGFDAAKLLMFAGFKTVFVIALSLMIQIPWLQPAHALDCPIFRRGGDAGIKKTFSSIKENGGHVLLVGRTYCRVTSLIDNAEYLCMAEVVEDWTHNPRTKRTSDYLRDAFENQVFYMQYQWFDGGSNIDVLFNKIMDFGPEVTSSTIVPARALILWPISAGKRRGRWITVAGVKLPVHGFVGVCSLYFPVLERFRMLAASANLQSRSQGGGD
jgi:hypothetical protein